MGLFGGNNYFHVVDGKGYSDDKVKKVFDYLLGLETPYEWEDYVMTQMYKALDAGESDSARACFDGLKKLDARLNTTETHVLLEKIRDFYYRKFL